MLSQIASLWQSEDFSKYLKDSLKAFGFDNLPLKACCKHSAVIDWNSIDFDITSKQQTKDYYRVFIGVFFQEILPGCACSDNSEEAQTTENGYCQIIIKVDKKDNTVEFTNAF